jgi:hypothetical protein
MDGGLVLTANLNVGTGGCIYLNGGYLAIAAQLSSSKIDAILANIRVGTASSSVAADLNSNIYCTYFSASGTADTLTGRDLDGYSVFYTSAVPEPSTYALFGGMGVLALVVLRRKRG